MTIYEILGKVFIRMGLENGPKGQKRIVVGGCLTSQTADCDVRHVTSYWGAQPFDMGFWPFPRTTINILS